jgi:hypothetical protein
VRLTLELCFTKECEKNKEVGEVGSDGSAYDQTRTHASEDQMRRGIEAGKARTKYAYPILDA